MTWRWLICSSLLLPCSVYGATVRGSVRLVDSAVPAVHRGMDNSGVVVWLEPVRPADGSVRTALPDRALMEQRDKQFVPHVLAIRVGGSVEFPNLDPIFHNAFSTFSGQIFDLGLYAPGTARTVRFDRAGVVRVFCNIHPTMSAVIVVLEHPWYAVTDRAGAFVIPQVPPGEYRLRVFHERAVEKTLRALERTATVAGQDLALPLLRISETGYVEQPHKNKYGRDYPPAHASTYRVGER